jgi:hypothetical protein
MKSFTLLLVIIAASACGKVESTESPADAFVAVPDPTVSTLAPDHGPSKGGTVVTLTGSGFGNAGDIKILLGNTLGKSAQAASDTTVTFMTPPGVPGSTVDIVVIDQRGNAAKMAAFRYNDVPTIASVSGPVSGTGGATVTVTGTGFMANEAGAPNVTVKGTAATGVQVVSDTKLTFTAPAIADPPFGAADVVVSNANGDATIVGGYHYSHAGLLFVDKGPSGSQHLFFLDPTAATPTPILIATGLPLVEGMAVHGTDIMISYRSDQDGTAHLAKLDVFGQMKKEAGRIVSAGTFLDRVELLDQNNILYGLVRTLCCNPSNYQLYRIDSQNGTATALGAQFTFPTYRHTLAVGTGSSARMVGTLDGPVYALPLSGGVAPTPLGSPLAANPNAYARGLATVGGTLYGLTNFNPDPAMSDGAHQALIVINPAGTYTVKTMLDNGNYRHLMATPAGW